MRLPRLLPLALGLAVLGVLYGSGGALGESAPSADISVSTAAMELPTATQTDATATTPLPLPVLVKSDGLLDVTVTNNGPDAADATVEVSYPGHRDDFLTTLTHPQLTDQQDCEPVRSWDMSCTELLQPGESWPLYANISANAPGPAAIDVDASSSLPDPDSTNNDAEWQTTVQCSITGTPGNDTLVVGPGESACGMGGNDTLIGEGNGVLGMYGGSGDDTFVVGQVGSSSVIVGGGEGTDTIDFSGATGPIMVCPVRADEVGGEPITDGTGFADFVDIETVIGSPYADRLIAGNGVVTIFGGGGSDWISGNSVDNALHGGPGNDRFNAAGGKADTISGGNGHDRVDADRHDRVVSAQDEPAPTFSDPCLPT